MQSIQQPKRPTSFTFLSFCFALAFPLLLYLLTKPEPVFRFIVPAFFALLVLWGCVYWPVLPRQGRFWFLCRGGLLHVAWLLIFFLLPNGQLQITYGLLSVAVLYAANQLISLTSETVTASFVILTAFGLSLGGAALGQYFQVNALLLSSGLFFSFFLLASANFVGTPSSARAQVLYALVVALCSVEIFISLQFLPFHFSTSGLLTSYFFYLVWSFVYYWQFDALNGRKMRFYTLLLVFLALFVLLATPWRIVA